MDAHVHGATGGTLSLAGDLSTVLKSAGTALAPIWFDVITASAVMDSSEAPDEKCQLAQG